MKKIATFLTFSFLALNLDASTNQPAADGYSNIRYENAFDLTKVNEKHKSTLQKIGCAVNVFENPESQEPEQEMGYTALDQDPEMTQSMAKYKKDCLTHMCRARLSALAEPSKKQLFEIAMCAIAYYGTMQVLSADSMGGSFAGFAYIQHMLFALPDIAMTVKNIIFKPNNALQDLENQFVSNQCFIPRSLWKKINNIFVEARQNQFTRESNVAFLKFVLDLKIFKNPKPIVFSTGLTLKEVKLELAKRIAEYFQNYEAVDDTVHAINRNVSKFLDAMIVYQQIGCIETFPRYLYLHGAGGIGKTHFVQKLSTWINELLNDVVRCDNVVIESNHQLEGDATHSGVILDTLRKQLRDEKNGSIVLIDEATWLNNPGMIDAAKRVFNGNQTKINSAFLNNGDIENSLKMPPMLILVANNTEISDKSLASRFDIVNFPRPNKTMLKSYALKIATESKYLKDMNTSVKPEVIDSWVNDFKEEQCNFRYVDSHVENLMIHKK